MSQWISAIKFKLRDWIRDSLLLVLRFLVGRPYLYKGPLNALKKYCPRVYQGMMQLLRRFKILGIEEKISRVRGDQEHTLSPLGKKILADLELIVPLRKKDEV